MTCGKCLCTVGGEFLSMPPKVKCAITDEYHCFTDECNCDVARVTREAEQESILNELRKPGPIMAINYDGPNAPSVSFSGEEVAAAYNTLISAPKYDESYVPGTDELLMSPTVTGATKCLLCGSEVSLTMYESGPKVCSDCKRIIRFVKEKHKSELEAFE